MSSNIRLFTCNLKGVYLFQVFFELQIKWNVTLLQLPGLCELFPVVFLCCQHLSPLLVLGFTTERYISVCHPFQRERLCTTRRALASIAGLVTFALTLNSAQGYFWHYVPDTGLCELRTEVTNNGSGSFWSVYSWITELLVFGLVPSVILVLNLFVIMETRRLAISDVVRVQHKVQAGPKDRPTPASAAAAGSSSSGVPSATTVMLLAVSFYLIVTTLPVTVFYVLYLSFPEGDPGLTGRDKADDITWRRHFAYNEIRTVVEEIGLSHYACNFYIYLCTGRIFRRELSRLFFGVVCRGGGRFQRSGDDSQPDTERTVIRIRTPRNSSARWLNNGSTATV